MPVPSEGASKAEWRRWARHRRAEVDPASISAQVADGLARWGGVRGLVLVYLPLPDEIDLTTLPDRLDADFAVTRTPDSGPLTVHPLGGAIETHRYGFAQPAGGAPRIDPAQLDVALVPGLAFDRSGGRLGRGAGYYDELLGHCRPDLVRVGVVPRALVVDRLPVTATDVAMTHLATEDGVAPVS